MKGGAVHLLNYETGYFVTETILVMDSWFVINQSLWYVNIDYKERYPVKSWNSGCIKICRLKRWFCQGYRNRCPQLIRLYLFLQPWIWPQCARGRADKSLNKLQQIVYLFLFVCLFVTKRINKQDNLASVCKRESRQKSKQTATNCCQSSLFVCLFVCLQTNKQG